MPRPSKRTPALLDRMKAMHAKDGSAREIADALGVDHGTICRWLRDAGLKPRGGAGRREKRPRVPIAAATATASAEALLALPRDDAEALAGGVESKRKRLAQIQQSLDSATSGLKDGSFPMTVFSALSREEQKYLVDLAQLEPPKAMDPESDPTNLAEAELVERRLRVLIEDAEKNARKAG